MDVIDAGDRFTGSPVGDHAREAGIPLMEGNEDSTGAVFESYFTHG